MGKSFSDLKYLQVLDHRRLMHTIDNNNCIYYDIYSLNFFEFLLGARYYAKWLIYFISINSHSNPVINLITKDHRVK